MLDDALPALQQTIDPRQHELLLGGQKCGKSRRAELMARQWLAQSSTHRAVLLATAHAGDAEMQARIARHQQERAIRVPGLQTVEVGANLAHAMHVHSQADTLLVVDCLTLWLTQRLMPLQPDSSDATFNAAQAGAQLAQQLGQCPGPVVFISNEIGLGVIPLGREVRRFVDALGALNQTIAAACTHVTLMAAGLPLALKQPF